MLGYSTSFEAALLEAGVPLRYLATGTGVPMYIEIRPAGPFSGRLVASMRPFTPTNAIRAIQIALRFPDVHGVHIARPELIGIEDIGRPWAGEPTEVRADELPVFWACRVAPQLAARQARPPLCITHTLGHPFPFYAVKPELGSCLFQLELHLANSARPRQSTPCTEQRRQGEERGRDAGGGLSDGLA